MLPKSSSSLVVVCTEDIVHMSCCCWTVCWTGIQNYCSKLTFDARSQNENQNQTRVFVVHVPTTMATSEKEGQNTSDCQVQEQKQTLEEETLQVTSPSRPLCPGVAAIKSQYVVTNFILAWTPRGWVVSELDPRKIEKEGLVNRLGWKCTLCPVWRHTSDCLLISILMCIYWKC